MSCFRDVLVHSIADFLPSECCLTLFWLRSLSLCLFLSLRFSLFLSDITQRTAKHSRFFSRAPNGIPVSNASETKNTSVYNENELSFACVSPYLIAGLLSSVLEFIFSLTVLSYFVSPANIFHCCSLTFFWIPMQICSTSAVLLSLTAPSHYAYTFLVYVAVLLCPIFR